MATITTAGSGNWNSTTPNAPWPSGTIPSSTDSVIIASGHIVTVADDRSITNVTITDSGTTYILVNSFCTLTISGSITNAAGASGRGFFGQSITGKLVLKGTTNLTKISYPSSAPVSIQIGDGSSTNTVTVNADVTSTSLGNLTISANATLSNSGNYGITMSGSLSNSGTLTQGTGTYTMTGSSKTISGTVTLGTLSISGTITNSNTLTVSTSLEGAGTLTQGSSSTLWLNGTTTITTLDASTNANYLGYTGSGAQTIKAVNYSTLYLGLDATATTKTWATGDVTIGTLIVYKRTTVAFYAGNTYTISGYASGNWRGNYLYKTTFVSTTPGTHYHFTNPASITVYFCDIKDCVASNTITAERSIDSGGNTSITFNSCTYYRSIGTTGTKFSTGTVTTSGSTATFTDAVTNAGVGDLLTVDGETIILSAKTSSTVFTLEQPSIGKSAKTFTLTRAYTDVNAWIAAVYSADLVTNKFIWAGLVVKDAAIQNTSAKILFTGHTTDATYYFDLGPHPDSAVTWASSTWYGNGACLDLYYNPGTSGFITIADSYTRVHGLELKTTIATTTGAPYVIHAETTATNVRVYNNFIHSFNQSSGYIYIALDFPSTTGAIIYNNVICDIKLRDTSFGIMLNLDACIGCIAYNNSIYFAGTTAYDKYGIYTPTAANAATRYIKNNISIVIKNGAGNVYCYSMHANVNKSNNLGSDTTGDIDNQTAAATFRVLTQGAEDLRAPAGSAATNAGLLNSADSNVPLTDIINSTRGTSATAIGAFETINAHASITIPSTTVDADGAGKLKLTGTGSPSLILTDVDGLGRLKLTGTGDLSLILVDADGLGELKLVGTGDVSIFDVITVEGSGSIGKNYVGTGDVTLLSTEADSEGYLTFIGVGDVTLTTVTVEANGTLTIVGTGDASTTILDVTGIGTTYKNPAGIGDPTLTLVEVSSQGRITITGTGDVSLILVEVEGRSIATGKGDVTLTTITVEANSVLRLTGTGDVTLTTISTEGVGVLHPQYESIGDVDLTLVEAEGNGVLTLVGTSEIISTLVEVDGVGILHQQVETTGDVDLTLVTTEGYGRLTLTGSGAISTPLVTIVGRCVRRFSGSGDITLFLSTIVAVGICHEQIETTGDVTLTTLTVEGRGVQKFFGTGNASLTLVEPLGAGSCSQFYTGVGAITFPLVVPYSSLTSEIFLTIPVTLVGKVYQVILAKF